MKQAEAALEAAKLDLDYTKLTAPFAGVVTHKTAHVGNRVQVGEPLLAIVPLGKLYVTANFKETQLTDVRVGQKAEIVADIYPGYTYQGHVDSISMGTGAAFSLLPPENATGNWVKVVQRVPVKIVIDGPQCPKTNRCGWDCRSKSRSISAIAADRCSPRSCSSITRKTARRCPTRRLTDGADRQHRPNRTGAEPSSVSRPAFSAICRTSRSPT